jgi:hypothetical protein
MRQSLAFFSLTAYLSAITGKKRCLTRRQLERDSGSGFKHEIHERHEPDGDADQNVKKFPLCSTGDHLVSFVMC